MISKGYLDRVFCIMKVNIMAETVEKLKGWKVIKKRPHRMPYDVRSLIGTSVLMFQI